MAAPRDEYLKTTVMTASKEMLTLMLWDGAIRFAEQGKDAILRKDIEGSYKAIVRAQKIITELTTSLRHDLNPDLTGKLAALYNFIYRRLVDANLQKEAKFVDDALEIMRHQRETWVMVMDKLSKEKVDGVQETVEANADAVTSAEKSTGNGEYSLPSAETPLMQTAPGRRAYPAFAVRPMPAGASAGLSVEG